MTETLERYCALFSQLRRAPGAAFGELTRRRAPHKPLLLLSVMDLAARGVLTSSFIGIEGDLTELNELFSNYWRRIFAPGQASSIAFPFSRLHNEPFWELVPREGRQISPAALNAVTAVSQLRRLAVGARIDQPLFRLMCAPAARAALAGELLRSCFSEEGARLVADQRAIHDQAFRYSLAIERSARQPRAGEQLAAEAYRAEARDQGFRRIVVRTYDHRCALCGVRIVTAEGHTAVDAAHIVPWSETRNDHVSNGMALCKLCHWAFDEGLMGVSDAYSVIVARQANAVPNAPGLLMLLAGRRILCPEDEALRPAQENFDWHRRRFRLA